jgi:AcrR family transcriptional regulator
MYTTTVARRQEEPRSGQKARTRAAIVAAAQRLRQDAGATPTVAEAAEASGVSRATAYRYFPTQEALDVEIADVMPAVAAIERDLAALDTPDAEQRLLALLDAFNLLAVGEEAHFRRALWVYQDIWLRSHRLGDEPPAVREGRRMRWLEHAPEPPDLPAGERRRLQAALALTLGMDSLVVMKDVCGLGDEEALEVLRWAAAAILRAGLGERDDGPTSPAVVT